MKVHYKCNIFKIIDYQGDPVAVMQKIKIPAMDEQFKMIKKLKSLFPERDIDFNYGLLDTCFCIRLKPAH